VPIRLIESVWLNIFLLLSLNRLYGTISMTVQRLSSALPAK
jgi:hypothetical protein